MFYGSGQRRKMWSLSEPVGSARSGAAGAQEVKNAKTTLGKLLVEGKGPRCGRQSTDIAIQRGITDTDS